MTEKDLATGNIGTEAKYDIAFKGGKLVLSLDYQGKDVGAGVSVSVNVSELLDKLAAAIPGHFDDALIEGAKAILNA